MLHSYSFSNFQSFADRTDVDLTIKGNSVFTDWMVNDVCGNRVSKLMAVIGHNGSGKTAFLKPIVFLQWFVSQSFSLNESATIPIFKHLLSSNNNSEFKCDFDFQNTLWRYKLTCTPEKVIHESLHKKIGQSYRYIFLRDEGSGTQRYKVKLKGFDLTVKEAEKVRPNSSLIAWAAQYGDQLAKEFVRGNVFTNITVIGRDSMTGQVLSSAAKFFYEWPEFQPWMNKLLTSWDLGLSSVQIQKFQANLHDPTDTDIWIPFGHHQSGNGVFTFSLPFNLESSGTQGAFILLSKLIPVLQNGGLAVIDEFENDLHPHMLEPILDLFANPETNPHNAQLIFSTHAIEVLNLLEKSQIYLVEKDEDCFSSAYRMDSIKEIRPDDNYYAKYMAGAYGAVPNL